MDFLLGQLLFLIPFMASFYLSVPIHEAGHLLCGLLTGYKFSSFRLFSLVWFREKEGEEIRFKISKNSLGIGGQCLMTPVSDEREFKFVLYNLGGGLFNFIFAAPAIVMLILTGHSTLLWAWGSAQIFMGLLNLVPMSIGLPNDGMNLLQALRSKDARRGFYLVLRVNSDLMGGKRLRDFDEQIFAVGDDANLNNYFVANIINLEASRLYDMGEYEQMLEQFKRLNLNKLQAFYRNNFKSDIAYYYIVHAPDFGKARQICQGEKMRAYLKLNMPPAMRVSAAYEYFVNGNREAGRAILAKARKELEAYPNAGARIMESDYCDMLEQKMGQVS